MTVEYFKHLNSNDLPLKTNLEMTRIFRLFNADVITDFVTESVEVISIQPLVLTAHLDQRLFAIVEIQFLGNC